MIILNLTFHYATALFIIIDTSIVDYVPKEKEEDKDIKSFVDNYPNLNIYDKIQILIYENYYEEIDEKIYCSSLDNNNNILDNLKTKSIPIPKPNKKKNYYNF